jgi:predicted AAA+ superfamily ATPase
MYVADIGLFVTLMFYDKPFVENDIYNKLLSDKLPANLGYLYENLVAQMIAATGRELYYHTWNKKDSTHYYEIDFLLSKGAKVSPIEVKSSTTGKHESLAVFKKVYSKNVGESYIISQKDVGQLEDIQLLPVYLTPFIAT